MVIILSKKLALALRVEEIFGSKELEYDTCNGPDVGACSPVFAANDGFRCAVLTGLYVFGIVLSGWRSVPQVSNLDGYPCLKECRAGCE